MSALPLPPDVRARLIARLVRCCEDALREELAREAARLPANDTPSPAAGRVGSRRP